MNFDILGRDDPDAPVVFLSAGLGGAWSYWKPQIAALGARYRIVACDHRGTGANAGPIEPGYSIEDMAAEAAVVADKALSIALQLGSEADDTRPDMPRKTALVGDKSGDVSQGTTAPGAARGVHFIGHALGGLVGLALALKAPERLRSLTLVNAWATVDVHTRRCFDARLALLDHGGAAAYVRAQPIFLFPAPWLSRNHDRIEAEIEHGIKHFQGEETLRRRIRALLSFDVSDRLDRIRVPTLVAAARDDVLVPYTASEALAAGIPGARLALAAEGGHGHSVTDPDAFNATLLNFLRTIDDT